MTYEKLSMYRIIFLTVICLVALALWCALLTSTAPAAEFKAIEPYGGGKRTFIEVPVVPAPAELLATEPAKKVKNEKPEAKIKGSCCQAVAKTWEKIDVLFYLATRPNPSVNIAKKARRIIIERLVTITQTQPSFYDKCEE